LAIDLAGQRKQYSTMPYDPTFYQGSAAYYAQGRPPYSHELVPTLAAELGLDGTGRLLDVGCGPGVLALALAGRFAEVVGLDPDAEMLAEGARRAAAARIANIRWVQALAEDIPTLDLGQFRLVSFGQSFHWTDRERVAEAVYDLLEPGGALALIGHAHAGRPQPRGPGEPPIPHDAIRALIERYLGPRRRAGQGFAALPTDRFEDALARTRFGVPRQIFCAGRPDIVQDIDGVLANYFSTSFAAPHLFAERRAQFEADLRAELAARSPSGRFWDWPGDTAILLATKPKE
jgi:SAM-dependent methyltransferase